MLKRVYRETKTVTTLSGRWFLLKSRQISWWIYDGVHVKQIFWNILGRLLLGVTIVRGAYLQKLLKIIDKAYLQKRLSAESP